MEKVAIGKIKSNPDNPRVIRDEKFYKLVKSIKEFPEMSDVRPIVVNKDMVVLGGNMRLKAMKEAGWKQVPVVMVDWDETRQKEFVIKDNASFGEWDWEDLANNWDDCPLDEWGLDVPLFTDNEKEIPFVETNEVDEDFKKGDLIEFGGVHRLLIGDGSDENHIASVLDGDKPAFTSADMGFTETFLDYSAMGAEGLIASNELNIRYCGVVTTARLATEIVEEWFKKYPQSELKRNGVNIF
jgi:hypothetical protein